MKFSQEFNFADFAFSSFTGTNFREFGLNFFFGRKRDLIYADRWKIREIREIRSHENIITLGMVYMQGRPPVVDACGSAVYKWKHFNMKFITIVFKNLPKPYCVTQYWVWLSNSIGSSYALISLHSRDFHLFAVPI